MGHQLDGRVIAILAADGAERDELEEPCAALAHVGARTELLWPPAGEVRARQEDPSDACRPTLEREVRIAAAGDYDALLLAGGAEHPGRSGLDEDGLDVIP